MSSIPLIPLAMSQTKEDLLKHLNMSTDTYILMAKEADRVYKWLTSDPAHLKKNCKRKPPYDWSDIVEKSKDDAMIRITQTTDQHTSYYWNLAVPTEDCPNWIARWFLYHKFRYRDGRNRNPTRGEDGRSTKRGSASGTKSSSRRSGEDGESMSSYDATHQFVAYHAMTDAMSSSSADPRYDASLACSPRYSYPQPRTQHSTSYIMNPSYTNSVDSSQESKPYYDPVRDV
ncbi:hypothetical protein PVAG01_00194 [Phlyctema vagabunda]|uniref:Uncharacterized protein n=1 Tax=Phlyctema vagabunda TaxID=108571 RepID=A0ABR4PTI9_9HELO